MTWKDILKKDDEKEELQIKLEELIEDWGKGKMQYNFEEMETGGFNSADGLNLDITFDRSRADDEGESDDLEQGDLFDADLAHYRIDFSTPSGKDIALADFTANGGYSGIIESNLDNLTIEELKSAIQGMYDV
tara:strand:- start:64 stop:462 length:399 start_codon:yes stop_codon:yes gene_type:complete